MGLSVATDMLEVTGRVLPSPIPIYGAGTDSDGPGSGFWNLRGKRFRKSECFRSWGLLYFPSVHRALGEPELKNFCMEFTRSMASSGIGCSQGLPTFAKGNPNGDIAQEIRDLYLKTGNDSQCRPDLLIFLVHQSSNPALYKAIKHVCELIHGVASQVMVVEKAAGGKGQLQYLGNISMKVNCKLGGVNTTIPEPLFSEARWMMIGGDSSHPSPSELRRDPPPPSYSALVGTHDRDCVAYTAVTSAQPGSKELIGTVGPMFAELLKRYEQKNNHFPDSIVYWRDGISGNEVPAFLETEVQALTLVREECKQPFKLTVVSAVKGHHTRFFPKSDRGDKLGNVLPCTFVENSAKTNDVFAVTQAALQGTCRPCHYAVLYDENNLSPDDFHRLILAGCFSYGRATRSVSLHPAVYYADQACQRSRLHLKNEDGKAVLAGVHERLTFTMYWQ